MIEIIMQLYIFYGYPYFTFCLGTGVPRRITYGGTYVVIVAHPRVHVTYTHAIYIARVKQLAS